MYDLMYDLFIDLFLLITMLNAKEPGDLTRSPGSISLL